MSTIEEQNVLIALQQEYRTLLQSHDWYYDYSDDHSVWTRGRNQHVKLQELARKVDPEYVVWEEFAPKQG